MTSASKKSLVINEIFFSIQGESTLAGHPCVFVRLTACDLRCAWCDTAYAFTEGTEMSYDAIAGKVKEYGCTLVEITGGEPLMQENVYALIQRLCDEGCKVMIETGGDRDMDIKCPGSKMEKRNRWENIDLLTPGDEVKFVIADETDYRWAKDIVLRYALPARCTILFSPVFGKIDNRALAGWILRDRLPVLFQLQMHKYIWDPTARGV